MSHATFLPKAMLFDFDGTLSVLTLDFKEMRKLVLEIFHRELPLENYQNLQKNLDLSIPVVEQMNCICASLDSGKAASLKTIVGKAMMDFELAAAGKSALLPGALDALKTLKRRGIKSAIVTRNCRASVNTVFPNHAEYCDIVLTREDVEKIKPDPEHVLAALRHIKVAPKDAIMVGDHSMDIEAGHRAGCKGAGVLTGENSAETLQKANPEYLARDVSELLRMMGI